MLKDSKALIIFEREYMMRVKKKSFIFTTLLMPLLLIGVTLLPVLMETMSEPDEIKVAVIDESGVLAQQLIAGEEGTARFVLTDAEIPDSALADKSVAAVLTIPSDVIEMGFGAKLFSHDAISLMTEADIMHAVNNAIENERLKAYNIENFSSILESVKCDMPLQVIRIGDEEENSSSSMVSFVIGEVFTFMLYFIIMLYGQMVMTGIIEEKTNRVLEIVVSSMKPSQLMLGKITGIGAVAVTQAFVWLVLMVTASTILAPMISPADSANAGAGLMQALAMLANPAYILKIFLYLVVFLAGGFLFYAAIYAAIGAAVDNVQDASQFQVFTILPIVLGLIMGMQAATDPNSTMALIWSLVPFTSPMVMMARIPFGVPAWQIVLSVVLMIAGIMLMIWISAKIYRVGIFMYGKKPTMSELLKWARAK